MGRACIAGLFTCLFRGPRPRPGSRRRRVLELATELAGGRHKVFDEIRRRALAAAKAGDDVRCDQYCFEELCCKAMYNAVSPRDPFDPSSPFSVAGAALRRGRSACRSRRWFPQSVGAS